MKGKEKTMREARDIIHRFRQGQSNRLINRDLGVHRQIIKGLRELAIFHKWINPDMLMPSEEEIARAWAKKNKAHTHILDSYHDQIDEWNKQNLSSVVICQLLKDKCPCDVQVVRRFRTKYFPKAIEPVMVRSTTPGKEMDLDFGELGRFVDSNDDVRRVWLFSLRLRHSRKAYREIVLDQTSRTFLMGHVHAFEHFNGVPQYSIPDNLKAAVIKSTTDNDMINKSYQELAEHYNFLISPCAPRTPEHKGGVEGDVKYVKRNFMPYFLAKQKEKNIQIPTVQDLIDELAIWDETVANVRLIHGVGRSPQDLFNSEEQKMLRPLPKERWEPTCWRQCEVKREWRVMVGSAYYSVPYQLIGKTVEVCSRDSIVRIFFENKEVALHKRATKPWEYMRNTMHAPPLQEAVLNCTREGLLQIATDIGPYTFQMAKTILSHPSVDKLKPVRCLLGLASKYSITRLENACKRALDCKLFNYKNVKTILENNLDSQAIEPPTSKIVPLPRFRFERDPLDYKSNSNSLKKETFEEKVERYHPFSRHGNAMLGASTALMADQIMDEEQQLHQEKKPI